MLYEEKKLTGENGAVDVDERINKKKNYERVRESVNKRDTANEREKTNLRIMCIFFVKKKKLIFNRSLRKYKHEY